ncbi:glycoside hydrolase family 3 protein [Streptosporangium sandarakinum]|uniref:glycoside hydrolase family 3 protein n=1 Tax=Streptosporangium sandarakinum TaxID=1260955 RepID=UPI0033ACD0EF
MSDNMPGSTSSGGSGRPGGSSGDPGLARMAMTVLQPGFDGTEPPEWLRRALGEGLGGAVLFARNLTGPAQTAELVAALRRENPDVIVAVDEEGGAVTRLEAVAGSSWPGNLALGMADDADRTERVARGIGRMLAAAGITLDYAPDADVNADPRNPVIGIRSFGSDPALVSRHTAAWVRGMQGAGVAACAKHFPGHGDTVTDSHLALPTVHASLDLLRERDLPPFRAAIETGVRAVMCGHLLVPALDPDRPATLSRPILTGLLREELGFGGMLVTDAIEMGAVAALHPPGEIAVRALAAGVDAICVGTSSPGGESVLAMRDAIVAAVRSGELAEERLAEAAARVLDLAAWYTANAAARAKVTGEREDASGDLGNGSGELGMEAARAALRVTVRDARLAPALPLARPPLVVDIAPRLNLAVAPGTPTGIFGAMTELMPGTTGHTVTADSPGLPDLGESGEAGRPLVLVAHDAHRQPWAAEVLARAVRLRPDAIVVETGVPGEPAGSVHIATHGISRVSARIVALHLTCGQ